ncbi:uncharacterized protein KIAA1755 homolog [Echinops telfairi]|uniref:Uncharacterized protein KIAA1755 homolog n=1 Tax=Echinops telfairi TaxID=9371 RepID=A0AC55DI73_ECHTE|nr:uncharacterized protein KIAA1755 homolog [Echinops telfairi]
MDPPSLDMAIQHALAGLYPPFEATAPTVLGQVFRLLESDFQGDGLNFLLDFLIPAKRLCEQVREAACAPYSHCLFLHEGWPLCLRNEVVVHLAPLNPLLLRQGDFYLQVEAREEQSVRIVIKYLSLDLRTVDRKPVDEASYPVLFTQEWLGTLNSDFEGRPLHSCLVASEKGISLMPWTKIARPEFVDDRPQAEHVLAPVLESLQLEALDLSSPLGLPQAGSPGSQELLVQSLVKGRSRTHRNKYPGLIKVEQARRQEAAFGADGVVNQDLEGDYVGLLDFSKESVGRSLGGEVGTSTGGSSGTLEELSQTEEGPLSQRMPPSSQVIGGSFLGKWTCAKSASSEEEPCPLSQRRKVKREVPIHNSEGAAQEPYLMVPETPLVCASGLRADSSAKPAASKGQGPLGNPEKMPQLRPGPQQASSPCPSPDSTPAPETKMADRTVQGSGRLPKPMTNPNQSTSSSGSPVPGLEFLKGQRLSPASPEKVLFYHDGPWKVPCSLYSPKSSQAKSMEKAGTAQARAAGLAADSGPLTGAEAGFPEASTGPPGKGPALDEAAPGPETRIGALSMEICHSGLACLPGGRDKAGRPLLLLSANAGPREAPWCSVSQVTKLLSYLCTIPRPKTKTEGLAVLIDARKQAPHPSLVKALQATQVLTPAAIQTLLFLGEKASARQLEMLPNVQVEVLPSLKALSCHVDPSQLPTALEGSLPYCHSEWVQFFQKLDPFRAELRQASSLLQASIEEFEKGDAPGGVQEAARCLSKSKELMEAVLRDPGLLVLQREGGATLARLRWEASRLDFNPDVRGKARLLYSSQEPVITRLMVTEVSSWMEQEGSRCLQALTPKEGSLETVEKIHTEFEDFFLQVAAQYRHGLELSKQAAQLGAATGGADEVDGATFPELAAFATTQRAFQTKLTHFYMAAERQRTDLETLLYLHRFCKKMTWFHMDCQDLMTQLRLGKAQGASSGDQRRLHRYLHRLASEFPAEKLTAMGLQVASLSWAGLGRDLWEEAQGHHEEIRALLTKALAHCPCPASSTAHTAHADLGGAVTKVLGLNRGSSRGRGHPPPQDSLGVDHLLKSRWPSRASREGQNRNFQLGPLPHAVEADGGKDPLDSALGTSPATPFSWPCFSRQLPPNQLPCLAGGSFSSEGTDSQTSLEDYPQTSPPASL